ncbi:MAG: hypothetical protein ACXVXC_06890 [Nocardioidaceae bacterium]
MTPPGVPVRELVRADTSGFWMPRGSEEVLDVYFGDQRVFAVAPDTLVEDGTGVRVAWPERLVRHLDGRAELRVVEHLTGTEVYAGPLALGESPGPIDFTDSQGRPLAIDKFGVAVRMFDSLDDAVAIALAEKVAALARDVDAFGVCAFLAYGSLLGAVRDGHVISHDTDADIAYLSRFTHPADVAMESFALERYLTARGWEIGRDRIGRVWADFEDAAGDDRHIDIFVGTVTDGHFFLDRVVEADLDRSAFEPQSTVTLEGVKILAPADPHALLEATYGPTYLTPDPAFAFDNPLSRERTSRALMGNYRFRRGAWVVHLRPQSEDRSARKPSRFARWVARQERDRGSAAYTLVDLGCGASTDAIWAARHGHPSIGVDFAWPMLRTLAGIARRAGLDARFWDVSFHDLRAVVAATAALAGTSGPRVLTCRHVVDVLDIEGRENLWLLARGALRDGGRMYLQWRTRGVGKDRAEPTFRPVPAARIEAEARAHGAHVVAREDKKRSTRLVLEWR